MKPNLKVFVSALVLALLLTGCTNRVLDYTIVSSKNVNLVLHAGATGPRTEGTDSRIVIFAIPFGNPSIKEATDRAIEAAGPEYDALIDGVISRCYCAFIFGKSTVNVEGTPINTTMLASLPAGDLAGRPILYHSSLKISNDEAIVAIGIVDATPTHQGDSSAP